MRILIACLTFFATIAAAVAAPSIDSELEAVLNKNPLAAQAVVITYAKQPGALETDRLAAIGVPGGVVMNHLPMVLTAVNKTQLSALAAQPDILSVYPNRTYDLYTNVSRAFIGQESLMRDREVIYANGGVPVSGKGVGVAVIDTGVDGTHNDVKLGNNLVQNVYFPFADAASPLGQGGIDITPGFLPPVYVENFPMTDVEGGHGTFVAGNIGATGASSGGYYGGVAPAANLIGLVAGSDAGLQTFAILHAYDWILANQTRYNIRVANNSFGSPLGDAANYDPYDPINVGSRAMHDRFIAVVYAAGNDGDDVGAINALAVAPWVISVAAGEKEGYGAPAGFSSRGIDNGGPVEAAGHPADPNAPPNLRPDITAPGANIKSVRSKGVGVTNLAGTALGQDLDIPPAFLPFYTTSQGTSFAAPHVAGVIALMIEANPQLTPQQIMLILRGTAMPMPYEERVVGAGYIDAHNAVRAALSMAPVAPPADLIPGPGAPELVDVRGDQLGTSAHDILTGRFAYDWATRRIQYSLEVADLSAASPNTRWTMQSSFGNMAIFVSSSVNELGEEEFEYGRITTLETGTQNQETLGAADAGEFDFETNTVRVWLDVAKVNAAVGSEVVGATSTSAQARTQILIGASVTGGLLLRADDANGRDFTLNDEPAPPPPPPNNDPEVVVCETDDTGGWEKERFAGAIMAGQTHEGVSFDHECGDLTAQAHFSGGGASGLTLVLENAQGGEIARAENGNGKNLKTVRLPDGEYRLRIDGAPSKSVDYVIQLKHRD